MLPFPYDFDTVAKKDLRKVHSEEFEKEFIYVNFVGKNSQWTQKSQNILNTEKLRYHTKI
jgi:hypothetical protein